MKKKIAVAIFAACVSAVSVHADPLSFGPYPSETYSEYGNPKATVAVAVMHGGWDLGGNSDNATVQQLCAYLAKHRIYIVAFNYRFATSGQGWPAQWQDAQLMIRWLRSKGYARVGIVGLSAGGYNTLGITFERGTITWAPTDPASEAELYPDESSIPDFAVAISPFSDLNDPKLSPIAVAHLTRQIAPARTLSDQAKRSIASPISIIRPDTPPLFVIHGVNDNLVPYQESQNLARQMRYIGGNMQFQLTRAGHLFSGLTTLQTDVLFRQIKECVLGADICPSGAAPQKK